MICFNIFLIVYFLLFPIIYLQEKMVKWNLPCCVLICDLSTFTYLSYIFVEETSIWEKSSKMC